MLSLIRDLGTGKIKGYGIFEYDNPNDVDLAIVALNGFVCGQNVIRVQKLGQQSTSTAAKPQPVAATAMANSMTQKIVKNPVLAMQVKQGREVGSRPSTVVQLMNAVYQEDVMDDQDYDDITAEVHAEVSMMCFISCMCARLRSMATSCGSSSQSLPRQLHMPRKASNRTFSLF